ncbi:MAG: [FeFe] hydrogenase H-cluster radical SAM maturase HydG [Myxococcota bacterium]|nr:[FeFe] hydrogenase H-cluster radical SAM maturase HydG [Myxococcota bacterium]
MSGLPPMTLTAGAHDFIDDVHLESLLDGPAPEPARVRAIIAKSLAKQALDLPETATLLRADDPALVEEIFEAARELKRTVYGNRIVLFAPLYVGNYCTNDCVYCAFRRSNTHQLRRALGEEQLRREVEALQHKGHKRLILVFGEHPDYDAEFIAEAVRTVYSVKTPPSGEIRRTNINAAPLDVAGYRTVKAAGIGTYQIFMETYHHATYAKVHPGRTRKGDYLYRLDGLDRAMEGGCDDVGLGALFGLYAWRFEVLGLVAHALHLQQKYGVGPHTISFPRLQPASGVVHDEQHLVADHDFLRVIAILRLAVPYTGLILTARERPALRRQAMGFGVSQIDAGSRIELGGYSEVGDAQVMEREQFALADIRPLDVVMRELLQDGYLPSFCTACYRAGRTGEHFMEFAIPGFIKRFCTPNALLTLLEYLLDYASPETLAAGRQLIAAELANLPDDPGRKLLVERLAQVEHEGRRDLRF